MNSAEKKFLYLAIFLFALGGVSRLGVFNKLYPLESISLPINSEIAVAAENTGNVENSENSENANFVNEANEGAASEQPAAKKAKTPKKKAPEFPININNASKEDLCFIKGVGPSLAQKIIDYREAKGSFRSAKDLEKVSGIGAKKRKSIEEFVKFE